MAKNKNNKKGNDKDKKKLSDLGRKDLMRRKDKLKNQVQNLKEQKKAADTKAEKQSIQKIIDKKSAKKLKVKEAMHNRDYKAPTAEQATNKIYNSDAFLGLSAANQEYIKGIVDSYTPEQLRNAKLTKKQIANIEADARLAAKKQFKGDKKEFDMDREQSIHADVVSLERTLKEQIARMNEDLSTGNGASADQRKIAIRQLQDALDESKSQYEVEAKRKNNYLQTQLEDIKYQLDTATTRADEDKIIQLRQLERSYKQNLRSVQDNMAQRGLAFSGIRFQAENELEEEYEDNRTTAEIEADRRQEDAQRLAMESERDVNTMVSTELEDLLYRYGVDQRTATQSAESMLGTTTTQGLLGSQYDIAGKSANDYLIGGLSGSLNEADKEVKRAYQDSLNKNVEAFEQTYGTKVLNSELGDAIKPSGSYEGYTPLGGITGTQTETYNDEIDKLKDDRAYNREQIAQTKKTNALQTKLLSLT